MKRKWFNKKKKLALATAILSAMEMSSGVSNMWLPMSNVAEAAEEHKSYYIGQVMRGANPSGSGAGGPRSRGVKVAWSSSTNRYEIFTQATYNDNIWTQGLDYNTDYSNKSLSTVGAATAVQILMNDGLDNSSSVSEEDINKIIEDSKNKANVSLDNITDTGKQVIKDTVSSNISAAEKRANNDATNKSNVAKSEAISAAATDATNKANKAESNAKTYTDEIANGKANIGLDNINEDGKNVIREIAKNEVKKSGVDTTGDTVIISKPMETEGIHVNGGITTTGNIKVGKDIHVNGNAGIDKDLTVKGNTTVDKNLTVHGNERVDGKLTVGDKATFEKDVLIKGNQEVNGNTTIHGSETIDRDLHVKGNAEADGNSTVHGNSTVDGDFKVKGNTTLGDDKNNDVVDVNAKTNLHGDTTIGDSDKDKLTVNATSEFTSNATFDKDVHIKGTLETDGNSVTHGNQTIDGDSHIKGNTEVGKDLRVHGNIVTEGTTNTGNLVSRGDAVIGGNTHAYGDIVLDGQFFSKGAAQFGDNVSITKNLTVGGNTYVAGDAKVDGDIYGRSFNVGDERYIDKNGINANGHNVRNVADGQIGPNSLDAVNGRQLYTVTSGFERKLTGNINEVAAGAAAMANLHPLEYNQNNKVSVAAAAGSYKNQQAIAVGAFYRPDRKTLVSFSGSLGSNDNMFGVGVSKRLGQVSEIEGMTEEQLQDKVIKLNNDNKALKAKDAAFDKQLAEMAAKNTDLKKSLSDMSKAYDKLMSRVNSLATELGELKAISQK